MTVIVVVIELPLDHIGDGLHAPMGVPLENAARKPVLHHEKKRVNGFGVATRRNKRPDAMLVRHALLHVRVVDPRHGPLKYAVFHKYVPPSSLTTFTAYLMFSG